MGNYYDAICDLLLGMTVIFSWVYPDVVYWSMQNAKIDSYLRAIPQEHTTLTKAVDIAREIGRVTPDTVMRTRAVISLLGKLGKEALTKEKIEQVFTLINVLIKGISSDDQVVGLAMVEMIKRACEQVPPWENLPLLFQVIDAAHAHFANNVAVRVTCTQINLREMMKKEGCSAENLLAISQKLREHFKDADKIYKQQIAEEIGALLQDEARFGKEKGAKIFEELETHYFPDFKENASNFDWKTVTERYKLAASQEKKEEAAPLLPPAAKVEAAKAAEEEGSDTDSEDSTIVHTPKGSSAAGALNASIALSTPGSVKALLDPQGSPPPASGAKEGKEEEAAAPTTPASSKSPEALSPESEAPAGRAPAAEKQESPPASPTAEAVFVPADDERVAEPAHAEGPVAPTPFSTPQAPSATPASKSKLGPALRVPFGQAAPEEEGSPLPTRARITTADKNWVAETSKPAAKHAANGDTLPPLWEMSPGTQAEQNTAAIDEMGLSPMSPLPSHVTEETSKDLIGTPNDLTEAQPAGEAVERIFTHSSKITPLRSEPAVGSANGAVLSHSDALTTPIKHEGEDSQQVTFHDGEGEIPEKKS
jgi:hypothetical protein